MNGRQLAGAAYHALAEQLTKAQQELVMLDLVADRFGANAIATSSLCRGNAGQALAKSAENIAFQRKHLIERIAELTTTLLEMEPVFDEARAADDRAFADFIRERFKPGK